MALTNRGREIVARLPQGLFRSSSTAGCEIERHEELCVGCGACAKTCPSGASTQGEMFDVNQLLDAPAESRRGALGAALRRLARHAPDGLIAVPARVTTYRTIVYDSDLCLGCGACARACPTEAIEARPPQATAEQTAAQTAPTAAITEAQA